MRSIIAMMIFSALCFPAKAEDWTTTDGKSYQDVTVVKVEADAVTIVDRDGGALVPLNVLSPELQKRFNYDVEKAKIASAARQLQEDASTEQIVQEKKAQEIQEQKLKQAQEELLAKQQQLATHAPPASSGVATTSSSSPATTPTGIPPASSQFTLNPGQSGPTDSSHQKVNPNWKLVWSDEFNGDSIDTSKWNFEIDGKGNGNEELEYYTDQPENAHVENGHLLITAIKNGTDAEGRTHRFTSARMTTKDKFSWKYGRFEARIKMPTGRGVWPAFWLMPQDSVYGSWARSGEIDIVEEIGHEPNTAYGTIHYGDKWPGNVHTGDKFVLPSGNLSDDFHVYAVEWEEGVIRWYIDGNLYETQTKWYTKDAPFPAPFDQNFFIILNFAVGGRWPGPPSADTVFPQTMDVDYVRVYQPSS